MRPVKDSRKGQCSRMGRVEKVLGFKASVKCQQRCSKGQVELGHVFFGAGRVHVKGERLGRGPQAGMGQGGTESSHAFLGRARGQP